MCCLLFVAFDQDSDEASMERERCVPKPTKPTMQAQCMLCMSSTDDAVCLVATCTAKCEIYAHKGCFAKRATTPQWRKKHHDRGNCESEVCFTLGCSGKCKSLLGRIDAGGTILVKPKKPPKPKNVTATTTVRVELDDPDRPCCFLAKDGYPCRRAAVHEETACKLHLKDLALQKTMLSKVCPPVTTEPADTTEEQELIQKELIEALDEVAKLRLLSSRLQKEVREAKRETDKLRTEKQKCEVQLEVLIKQHEESRAAEKATVLDELRDKVVGFLFEL